MNRLLPGLVAVALVALAAWLLEPSRWRHGGARLDPPRLTLAPGKRRQVQLISNEGHVAAYAFRVRYDPAIVEIEDPVPAHPDIVTGGIGIALPAVQEPGILAVRGIAVTGGRVFEPSTPIYRFTVRGIAAGTSALTVEGLIAVDLTNDRRSVLVAPLQITVHP